MAKKSSKKESKKSSKKSKDSGTFKDKNLSKQIESLQSKVLGYTAPTAEETGVSTQLGNITGSSALGQAAAQDPTKNPVAMGFQTGQAAAIQRGAEAQSVPLRERLALMQASRQTAMEGATKELGFASDRYASEQLAFEKSQALKSAQKIAKQKSATDISKSQISAAKEKTGSTAQKSASFSAPKTITVTDPDNPRRKITKQWINGKWENV